VIIVFDFLFLFSGWVVGQLLFQGYEAHVPWSKRLGKLAVMTLIFAVVLVSLSQWHSLADG